MAVLSVHGFGWECEEWLDNETRLKHAIIYQDQDMRLTKRDTEIRTGEEVYSSLRRFWTSVVLRLCPIVSDELMTLMHGHRNLKIQYFHSEPQLNSPPQHTPSS